MIDEYVVVPDVFDPSAYSDPAVFRMGMRILRTVILKQDALVADLADGKWSEYCTSPSRALDISCKEIIRKLREKNRLRRHQPVGKETLDTAEDWCLEGVAAMTRNAVTGVIASEATKHAFPQPQVASIENLTSANWYRPGACTELVDRKTGEYLRHLDKLLKQARSIMFIDPYLDPSASNFREFHKLLAPLADRSTQPKIELHRTFFCGDGPQRTFPTLDEWQTRFRKLEVGLGGSGLRVDVFLWDDWHDRYLITDITGIHVGAGFDITGKPGDISTWARLEEPAKAALERQFDPNYGTLKQQFSIQL